MKQSIKIGKSLMLELNPNIIQISPKGREIRLSGVRRISEDKWINGVFKFCTAYDFIYLDNKEIISFEFDEMLNYVKFT